MRSNTLSLKNGAALKSWAAAVGVTAVIAVGAVTPSFANSNDGGPLNPVPNVSSDSSTAAFAAVDPDYAPVVRVAARHTVKHRPAYRSDAYRARAQAYSPVRVRPAVRHYGARYDDPPGSAFQTRGSYEDDMGCPC